MSGAKVKTANEDRHARTGLAVFTAWNRRDSIPGRQKDRGHFLGNFWLDCQNGRESAKSARLFLIPLVTFPPNCEKLP